MSRDSGFGEAIDTYIEMARLDHARSGHSPTNKFGFCAEADGISAGYCRDGILLAAIDYVVSRRERKPAGITVDWLAQALDDHLPRMAFRQYGQSYNDDPDFDIEAYYRRVAEAIVLTLPAPSQSEPQRPTEGLVEPAWVELANDIRIVDGNHDLGAGELAARLAERGWQKAMVAPEREPVGALTYSGAASSPAQGSEELARLLDAIEAHRKASDWIVGTGAATEASYEEADRRLSAALAELDAAEKAARAALSDRRPA